MKSWLIIFITCWNFEELLEAASHSVKMNCSACRDGRAGEWSPVSWHCCLLGWLLPCWYSGHKRLGPGSVKTQLRDAQSAGNLPEESPETIRSATPEEESDAEFNDWLAGLIDADGGFYLSKQGYASCEIIMHSKEVQTLAFIKSQIRWQSNSSGGFQ